MNRSIFSAQIALIAFPCFALPCPSLWGGFNDISCAPSHRMMPFSENFQSSCWPPKQHSSLPHGEQNTLRETSTPTQEQLDLWETTLKETETAYRTTSSEAPSTQAPSDQLTFREFEYPNQWYSPQRFRLAGNPSLEGVTVHSSPSALKKRLNARGKIFLTLPQHTLDHTCTDQEIDHKKENCFKKSKACSDIVNLKGTMYRRCVRNFLRFCLSKIKNSVCIEERVSDICDKNTFTTDGNVYDFTLDTPLNPQDIKCLQRLGEQKGTDLSVSVQFYQWIQTTNILNHFFRLLPKIDLSFEILLKVLRFPGEQPPESTPPPSRS